MPSISNACSGPIPDITSVKGGGCGRPQVGLSLAAMADVKILVREDIQQKGSMYGFKLMSTMCEGGLFLARNDGSSAAEC